MANEKIPPGVAQEHDELAAELQRLRPVLQRQRRAAAVPLDAGFQRALRAQLTAPPRGSAQHDTPSPWRTLIAMLLPSRPQLSLRGHAPHLLTYTAANVTISLTARTSTGAGLVSLYGEVDLPGAHLEQTAQATVEALRGETVAAATVLDNLGNFVLPDLPPRVYALRLRFPDRREIMIPPTRYDVADEAPLD